MAGTRSERGRGIAIASSSSTMAAGAGDELDGLAGALRREFEAPAGLLDPAARRWRLRVGADPTAFPTAEQARPIALFRGEVLLWSAPGRPGVVWLVLPINSGPAQGLSAWVGFAAAADGGSSAADGFGTRCPPRALIAWGREVLERLQVALPPRAYLPLIPVDAAAPLGSAVDAAELDRRRRLSDGLMRRLRVSDPPERFQQLAARALREVLDVEAVAWVPSHRREPVIVAQGREGPAPELFRALLGAAGDESVLRINDAADPTLAATPGIQRVLGVAADLEGPSGWIFAINPIDHRRFAREEAEILRPVASLIATQRINARHYAELKELLFGVIRSLTSAIDAKDPYTLGHSERVGRIAVQLGESMGLSAVERGDLYLMGLLHDVGKIGIEDAVLKKAGPLNADEFKLIQSHVRIGVQILNDLKKLHHLLPGVLHHHENYDGTGYPSGLAGDQIPKPARILAVADAFDAMSSNRPYRDRLSTDEIEQRFRDGAGTQWDPRVVEALQRCRGKVERIRQKGLGDSVRNVVDDTLGRP